MYKPDTNITTLRMPLEASRLNYWVVRVDISYSKITAFFASRYKRIFSVGTLGITTYNPTNMEITNQVNVVVKRVI